jgi:hypothetical protein
MRRAIKTCEILPWYSQARSSHIILSVKLRLHIRLSLNYRKRLEEQREGRFQRKVSSAMDFQLLPSTPFRDIKCMREIKRLLVYTSHDVQ